VEAANTWDVEKIEFEASGPEDIYRQLRRLGFSHGTAQHIARQAQLK
jgi:hypothetical protein